MGCCGGRDRDEPVKARQKWDYINLNDFRSSSCFTPISYGILWIMLGVSIACYIADFSSMINLLIWASYGTNGLPPPKIFNSDAIPRWTFTGCIILSYVLLIYRWYRAIRAMRSGGVAKCYLDPLAARIISIRPGKRGRGYRRFLVFAELTKSKHGTEYIALFVHFAFEAWLRIIFAEGPRNAINAYTIYHLVQSWTQDGNSPDTNVGDSGIQKFWAAAQQAANNNHLQVAVFFGMIFTIVIWVIAFIGLVVAFILYIMFLWHHIPKQDGGLRGYCKRKVDKSVERIVSAKIKKALEKEAQEFAKDAKNSKGGKGGLREAPSDLKRQPTVPVLGDEESAILPPFGARPGTPASIFDREPTLPETGSIASRPGMPSRMGTGYSTTSFSSDVPLLDGAADFGRGEPGRSYSPAPGGMPPRSYSPVTGRSASPAPTRPFTPTGELVMGRAPSAGPQRSMTPGGRPPMNGPGPQRSYPPAGPPPFASGGQPPRPFRQNTDFSTGRASPAPGQPRQLTPGMSGPGPGPRTGSAMSGPNSGRFTPNGPPPRLDTASPYGPQGRQPTAFNRPGPYGERGPGRQSPAQEFEMTPQARPSPPPNGYQAYQPNVQSPSTPVDAGRPLLGQPHMGGPQRSGTAPPQSFDPGYSDSMIDDYAREPTLPPSFTRSNTGPPPGSGTRWQ